MGSDSTRSKGCAKFSLIMMHVLDGDATAKQNEAFDAHVSACPSCAADFAVYRSIMAEFALAPVVLAAPDGFEERVMKKVAAVAVAAESAKKRLAAAGSRQLESVLLAACGVLCVACGVILPIYMNWAAIAAFASQNAVAAGVLEGLPSVGAGLKAVGGGVVNFVTMFAAGFGEFVSSYRYVIILVFAALSLVQYALRGSKVSGVAFAEEKGGKDAE